MAVARPLNIYILGRETLEKELETKELHEEEDMKKHAQEAKGIS